MSSPKSRLSAFRSYSYYHVLAMCDSSNTANLLAHSEQPGVWDHATPTTRAVDTRPNTQTLGKYSPKCISDPTGANTQECAGRYIILVNGSSDAAFSITQARWSSSTAAAAVPEDGNTSLAVEGTISISEPKGVAFLDQVVKCSIALGVDSSQIVYCLKTFFVGFAQDTNLDDVPVHITDIPPINFITYDVTGSFTETGGTYDMMFVALASGATRLPQYSKAVNAMQITAKNSLFETLQKLNDNINQSYDAYFNCIKAQLEKSGSKEAKALADSLCRVKYVITTGKDYQSPDYKISEQSPQSKNTSECGSESQITFPKNTSIETAISTIMQMSPQVRAEMDKGDKSDKRKYEYKIHTCLKSTPISGSSEHVGKLEYTVYYRVNRFQSPKTVSHDPAFVQLAQDDIDGKINTDTDDPFYKKLRNNIITFDYLYTGKNIDILEFDIRLNMGMAYIQTATLANTLKGQLERAPVSLTQQSSQDATSRASGRFGEGSIPQTPVFFGKQITTPSFMNAVNSGQAIQSAYTLAKHASLEVADAKVRIVGNDLLLASTNIATSPEYMVSQENPTDDGLFNPGEANFKDWSLVPAYVKIKIKMPRDNDDFALFTGHTNGDGSAMSSNADYARDFWFDGYYYVCGIDHVFDNGEFTQTLDMISIPKVSTVESLKAASESKEVSFDEGVDECFDNKVGCGRPKTEASGSRATNAVPVVSTPPPPSTTSVTANDAKSIAAAPKELSNVKGWDNIAKPHVKAAIINAANGTGVNAVTLAQFAYLESTFNPDATTSGSKALGLYQFVPGTWHVSSVKPQGIITEQVLANQNNRRDPTLSAYAAALYMKRNASIIGSSAVGDLYLAHFLGPGGPATNNGAWKIIKDDASGNGSLTITQSLPQSVKKIIAANAGVFTPTTTVREVRNWAANKMAISSLNQPTVVARNANPPPTSGKARRVVTPDTTPAPGRGNIQKVHKRKAADAVASQQDCTAQNEKKPEDREKCASEPGARESTGAGDTPQA